MCGRMAQTLGVVDIAARKLREALDTTSNSPIHNPSSGNFNLSPGMDCDVMLVDENGDLQIERMKWGLIRKSGTAKKPLYNDESEIIKLCFESLCFNARSDTLYSKPTFSKLALGRRTCVIAVDGYFEWKSHPIPKMKKAKQPYFVYRKEQLDEDSQKRNSRNDPLFIAGLWTKVSTGISEAPELESFSMLTTDASEQIKWLHHRMPVCFWDIELAKQWLLQPSETLMKKIDNEARCNNNGFCWHKVTPEMSKLSFRSEEAILEVKETNRSIKHFFARGKSLAKKFDSSCSGGTQTNQIEVKTQPIVRTTSNVTKPLLQDFSPAQTKNGKRQLTFSSSYLSPACKKGKVKKSPRNLKSNKQISIDSFFGKMKPMINDK